MKCLLTRWLGRLPIGWLQLKHNPARLAAAAGGVAFADVLIFMQLGFMFALFETSVLTHRRFDADVVIVASDFQTLREANPLPRRRMYDALAAPGVVEATPVHLATMLWTNPDYGDTTNFRVVGVDPRGAVFSEPKLQSQTALLRESDSALVDRRSRDFPRAITAVLAAGGSHEIEALGRRLVFRGMFDQGASFDVDGSLVVSDQTFLELFPSRSSADPNLILVRCAPGEDPDVVADRINSRLPESDAKALSMRQFVAAEQGYQAKQSPVGFVFGFGVAIGLVVGLVIVYQVLSSDVHDHLAEYATFKAIGYSPGTLLGIVFEEALCLSAIGFIPSFVISSILYRVAAAATALPISMPWSRPLFVFALTAVMCSLSGAIATQRLRSADPAELF